MLTQNLCSRCPSFRSFWTSMDSSLHRGGSVSWETITFPGELCAALQFHDFRVFTGLSMKFEVGGAQRIEWPPLFRTLHSPAWLHFLEPLLLQEFN